MAHSTHDVRKSGTNKRYSLTPADSTVSYMFLISWTAAKVVKVQITKDFKLTSYKVSNIRGQYTILEVKQITMKAGQTLYFTKSSMNQMYYLTSEQGCTCKAGRMRQACHHVADVTAFVAKSERTPEPEPLVASEVTSGVTETRHTRIPAGATVYHVDGQIVHHERFLNVWFCTCCETDGGILYRRCEHISAVLGAIAQEQAAA